MGAAWRRAGGLLVAVVALDQVSKAIATGAVERGAHERLFPGIDIVNVRNSGVAFGFFSGGGGLVVAITAAALALVVVYFALHGTRPLVWLPTGLLLGGAIGNLVDRVRLDAVRDWIDIPLWPAFNLADTAITIGVLVLLYVLEAGRPGSRAGERVGDGMLGGDRGPA
jgi:signal peptidase II